MNLQVIVFKNCKLGRKNYWENLGLHLQNFKNENNKFLKDKIYKENIKPIFDEMTENIINIYAFYVSNKSKNRFKYDCVRYLKSKINRFDVTKPDKAFSYWNVVSKGWLCYQYHVDKKHIKDKLSGR